MTNTPEERNTARSVQRGIPILFIVMGVLALRTRAVPGSPPADFVAGLIAILFAGALFLKLSWARWMALGACFLAIVGACTLPALLFVRDPLRAFADPYADTAFTNALLSVFGFAFGGLGYKGLKYYRSDLARVEHAPRSLRPENVAPEHSTSVLYSFAVWLVLIAVGWKLGMTVPTSLFKNPPQVTRQLDAQGAPVASQLPRIESSDAVASDAEPPVTAMEEDFPDLVPVGLCMRSVRERSVAVPVIELAYTNRGGALRADFRYSSTEDGQSRMTARDLRIAVPSPNALAFTDFMRDTGFLPNPGTSAAISVTLDPDNSIEERDEGNNSMSFAVSRDRNYRIDVPNCNSLSLRINSNP